MPRLAVFVDKTVAELVDLYELATTDLANQHRELAEMLSSLHISYLESFSHSKGKSVAERNRDADYTTKAEYAKVVQVRGEINNLTVRRDMLNSLINWKMRLYADPPTGLTETYPVNFDEGRIGNGSR